MDLTTQNLTTHSAPIPHAQAEGPLTWAHFEQTQPLATQMITQGLKQQRLSHGLLCTGQPTGRMYQLLHHTYTVMACESPPSPLQACHNCRSCHWMATNAHPGFMTISPLSFFVAANKEEKGSTTPEALSPEDANALIMHPPSQIHVGQIRYLLQQLGRQAGSYPRMIVFTNAEMTQSTTVASATNTATNTSPLIPPFDWQALPNAEDKTWVPLPLKPALFNAASANRFLKALEEPGARTHFVFLAQHADDVLATIQSRCQVVPFQPEPVQATIPIEVTTFWQNWLNSPQSQLPHQWHQQLIKNIITPQYPALACIRDSLTWAHQQRLQWVDSAKAIQWKHFAVLLNNVEQMLHQHVSPEQACLTLFLTTSI
jgi:hypothetical protein